MNIESINTFSIKDYLLNNNLIVDAGNNMSLVASPWEVSEVAHKVSSGYEDTIKIVLCSTIMAWNDHRPDELEKLQFSLTATVDSYDLNVWTIWLSWKDKSSYHGLDWQLAVSAVENIIPYMAGSNASYLAGQLVYDL